MNHVIPMSPPVVSQVQESHVAPHFAYLDLMNGIVSLMMLLVSCGVDAAANGVT